jgi:type IV pilus assembly protein PilB
VRLNRSATRAGDAEDIARLPGPRHGRPEPGGFGGGGVGGTGFAGGATLADLEPIAHILVRQGALTHDQLAEPLLTQPTSGKRLGPLLIELGLIDERALTAALAEQLGLEIVDLREIAPDPAVVPRLPEPAARELHAIPLFEDADGTVVVAVFDPGDAVAPELRRAIGGPVRLVLAPGGEIQRAIATAYRVLVGVEEHVAAFTAVHGGRPVVATASAPVTGDDAPVVQLVNMMITQALRDRASDIHVEPQDTSVRVRYRIDGALHDVLELPSSMASAVTSRIKIMAGMNIVERRRRRTARSR